MSVDEAIALVKNPQGYVWVDVLTSDTPAARELLRDRFGFHELAVEDSLSHLERPQLMEFDDVWFFSVPSIVNATHRDEEYDEIGFFLGHSFLVTVTTLPSPELDRVFDDWTGRRVRLALGPASAAHAVVDAMVDAYFPTLDALEDRMEDVFDRLLEGSTNELAAILEAKRDLATMRRRLNPVRDVLNAILRLDESDLPRAVIPYFRDVLDHVLRLLETVEDVRDQIGSMLDVHVSQTNLVLNQVMKKMTAYSVALMTMAIVSGVYGMNFEGMPELHWRYGYDYALGLMFTLGGLALLAFRLAKWI